MQKFLLVQQAVFKQIKSEDEPWGHILPAFLSKADATTVVLRHYQHYLHIVLKIPLPMLILTFRGLSHVKMYEILSSSGKSKVKQCAIESTSSLIWRWNQVCWEANLLPDVLQLRHAGSWSCVNISLKPIARLSKPSLSHESTVNIGHYRKIC